MQKEHDWLERGWSQTKHFISACCIFWSRCFFLKKKKKSFGKSKEKNLVLTSCSPILHHSLKGFLHRFLFTLAPVCHYPHFAVLLPKVILSLFTTVCAFPHLDASSLPNYGYQLSKSWHTQGMQPRASRGPSSAVTWATNYPFSSASFHCINEKAGTRWKGVW